MLVLSQSADAIIQNQLTVNWHTSYLTFSTAGKV